MSKFHTTELVAHVTAANPGINKYRIRELVASVLDGITQLTEQPNDLLILRGFGTFERRVRDARLARNPLTGETVQVPAKATLRFRASK